MAQAAIINLITEFQNAIGLEPFTNQFHLNETCMVLIVVYILLFMYKKEVMAMVNKFLK